MCGKDVRVYAWEKPIGKGWKEPGFATVCAHAAECRSLAESLSGKKSGKDKALREYLVEQHLLSHDAEEEKASRGAGGEGARGGEGDPRGEQGEVRRVGPKTKRSHRDENRGGRRAKTKGGGGGRGAGRGGGDRRRAGRGATDGVLAMDAPPAAAQTRGGARRDEPRDVRRRLAAEAAETANAQTASLSGEASVGRYVKIHWDADGAWYDAKVESHDARTGQHTVRASRMTRWRRWISTESGNDGCPSRRTRPLPAGHPAGGGGTAGFGIPRRADGREGRDERCARAARARRAGRTRRGPVGDGTRKAHSCRACAERGVVATDHAKFSRACPFHPEYASKAKKSAEATVEKAANGTESAEEKAANGIESAEERAADGAAPTEGAADGAEPRGDDGALMDVDVAAEDAPATCEP